MGKRGKLAQQKKSYRNKVETLREKDERALKLIKQHVDDSILPLIADATSAREAWEILRREFDERGSSKIKIGESHSSAQPVDESEDNEEAASPAVLQENPASTLADDVNVAVSLFAETEARLEEEHAMLEVASELVEAPSTVYEIEAAIAAEVEAEQLIESLLMREIVFPNNVLDCVCVGTEKNQPAADSNEKKPFETKYDEELLSCEEKQKLKDEISLITDLLIGRTAVNVNSADDNTAFAEHEIIQEFLQNVDSLIETEKAEDCTDSAKIAEDGSSHIATRDEEMCIADARDEDETSENIFQKWSLEEIRLYYQMMWQQATEHNESAMRAEHSMLEHAYLKYEVEAQKFEGLMNQNENKETWHEAIPAIEEFEEKQTKKKKKLKKSWFMKNRTKKKLKKKTRRVPEFRVWSKRKKKKLQQVKQNKFFVNICKPG